MIPMLYRELLPRNLPWARELDALLPSFEHGVAHVVTRRTDDGETIVNGILNEPSWKPLLSEADASVYVLHGWPRATNPRMSLSLADDALLVTLKCSAGPAAGSATLDLFLQEAYPVPLSAAPALHIQYAYETSQVIAQYGTGQSKEESHDCEFALTRDGAVLAVEGRIPLKTLDRQATGINSGERWRLNAVLTSTDASGKKTAICRWGFPDESLVRHGAVLILD
ncbi:MAG: hypothetical protein IT364_26110 [Candidatus Hydrogenedentes bacterium]|nr:hypothetical protein [Candidatus Hydrogenedentota bacterium]